MPEFLQNLLVSIALFVQKNKFSILTLFALVFLAYFLRGAKQSKDEFKRSSKVSIFFKRCKMYMRKLYVKFMHLTQQIPIVGDLTSNIAYGYKCQEALTDDIAMLRTGRVLCLTVISFVIAFIFGFYWFTDFVLALVTAFMIAHITMTSLKSNSRKFLINLNDAVEDFLLAFHKSSGNIDAAFHTVIQSKNPVGRHFEIMHGYIKRAYVSDDPDLIQAEYNEIAPSRFLRNLYAVIYMTYKYGDQKSEGRSALNVNIMEIQEQIGDSLYQQNKLIDDTMGERWFIIAPLYALPLLSSYMLEYFAFEGFEYIESFLTSSTGYIIRVLCAIISLICYLLYAKMVDRGILEPKSKSSWENKVLRNAYVRRIAQFLLPSDSPKRASLQAVINKAGSNDTVNALQIRRIFLAGFLAVAATISIGLNIWNNTSSIYNNIYLGMARDNYTTILKTQNDTDAYINEMLAADKLVVKHFRHQTSYWQMNDEDQQDAILTYLHESGLAEAYRNYESYGASRIHSKLNQLQDVTGMSNLLFVILLTLFGYYIPLVLLYLQAFMNKDMLLLDEVSDLQKTTIMLMEYSSTTPSGLLTWYASSAILLAPQLRECRITHNFQRAMGSIDYKPFVQLMTSLEMAFNGLPLKEAFSGVEQRLLTQRKEQGRVVERMLKFRTSTVEMFTSISMGAVIGLYMFMPLLIAMLQMFMSLDMF